MPNSRPMGLPTNATRLPPNNHKSFTSNTCGQNLPAILTYRFRYSLPRARFGKENHATAAAGAADFGSLGSRPGCCLHQLFNQRRGDAWSVGLAQLPFFPQQPCHLQPVGMGDSLMHGTGNFANLFKVAKDLAIAIDMRLEHFPVVNARLPRRARVRQHKTMV